MVICIVPYSSCDFSLTILSFDINISKIYNTALMINEDCRTADSLSYRKNLEMLINRIKMTQIFGWKVSLIVSLDFICCNN